MFRRFSIVGNVSIVSVGISGVLQIGDTNNIEGKNRSIAVQREDDTFEKQTVHFNDFQLFLDSEITFPTITQDVRPHTIQACPFITVERLDVLNILNSGILHIGSLDYSYTNTRLLQIRQYGKQNDMPTGSSILHNRKNKLKK